MSTTLEQLFPTRAKTQNLCFWWPSRGSTSVNARKRQRNWYICDRNTHRYLQKATCFRISLQTCGTGRLAKNETFGGWRKSNLSLTKADLSSMDYGKLRSQFWCDLFGWIVAKINNQSCRSQQRRWTTIGASEENKTTKSWLVEWCSLQNPKRMSITL